MPAKQIKPIEDRPLGLPQRAVLKGIVVRGEGYGRKLGFPTANIERRSFSRLKVKPRLGVWSGYTFIRVGNGLDRSISMGGSSPAPTLRIYRTIIVGKRSRLKDKGYISAIVIGPIDKTGLPKIEAHLIGFKGNLYGKKITLVLKEYIRPFRKFKNEAELINQIHKDVIKINTEK